MKRICITLYLLLFVIATTVQAESRKNGKTPDFFAVATVDKNEADVNDQVLYTIKFYMEPNAQLEAVGNIHFKFEGFDAEEIDPFFFQNYQSERYKGKVYRTLTWKQFVLSPKKKGSFVIPSYKATASLIVYTNDGYDEMDPFSFFFRQRRGQRKALAFSTKALKVKITGDKKKARPQQPESQDEDDGVEYKKL